MKISMYSLTYSLINSCLESNWTAASLPKKQSKIHAFYDLMKCNICRQINSEVIARKLILNTHTPEILNSSALGTALEVWRHVPHISE